MHDLGKLHKSNWFFSLILSEDGVGPKCNPESIYQRGLWGEGRSPPGYRIFYWRPIWLNVSMVSMWADIHGFNISMSSIRAAIHWCNISMVSKSGQISMDAVFRWLQSGHISMHSIFLQLQSLQLWSNIGVVAGEIGPRKCKFKVCREILKRP